MLHFKPVVQNTSYFNIEKRCVSPRTNFFLFRLETKQSKLVSTMIASKTVATGVNNEVRFNSRSVDFSYYLTAGEGNEMVRNGALIDFANDWSSAGTVIQVIGGGAQISQSSNIGQSHATALPYTLYTIRFDITEVTGAAKLFINLYGGYLEITPTVTSYNIQLTSSSANNAFNILNSQSSASSFVIKNISVKQTIAHEEQTFLGVKSNSEMVLKIYEQTSSINLDPTDASVLGLRWQGLAVLPGTSEVEYQQHEDPSTQNYVYFKE